eukprot:TRINITY_DN5225_c0_g2_i3.p1 TRINITY_DN5225_c0_g2~~TRINITY_DN5225_c0_g2_i3.p1  ORF type:complete len:113 (-),score=1.92 TRINITY_DN5225_c0_g2_i3:32-370(-)
MIIIGGLSSISGIVVLHEYQARKYRYNHTEDEVTAVIGASALLLGMFLLILGTFQVFLSRIYQLAIDFCDNEDDEFRIRDPYLNVQMGVPVSVFPPSQMYSPKDSYDVSLSN